MKTTLLLLLCGLLFPQFSLAQIEPDWKSVEKRLVKEGFKRNFIKELKKTYEPEEFKNVLELNVLLYLKKGDHHGVQVTDEATDRVRSFMEENHDVLVKTEKSSGVPSSVISSLLFIESRYGQNLGKFHVASVFVHLIQADRPSVVKYLRTKGTKRFSDNPSKKDLAKIPDRTKTKVKWAMGELKAIEKIYKEKGKIAFKIRGSFAGAFGMSQFLPSSYARWAKSAAPGAPPDLNQAGDAIASVGNYLKSNGWRKTRVKTHMKALLNYNNSRDYANAILNLAEKARSPKLADSR